MSFEIKQKDVDKWTNQWQPQYWQPHEITARLMEEVGELAREINYRWGPKKKKPTEDKADIADEIADIFFTLICLANSQGINLEEAWSKMMQKYSERDKERFEKKE
jgi:NTP pyrophosphatase (non-canonical NTP hydrolase)